MTEKRMPRRGPEQVKALRGAWRGGAHSYPFYLATATRGTV